MCTSVCHILPLDAVSSKMHEILSNACHSLFCHGLMNLSPSGISLNGGIGCGVRVANPLLAMCITLWSPPEPPVIVKFVEQDVSKGKIATVTSSIIPKTQKNFDSKLETISGICSRTFVPAISGKTGADAANCFAKDLTDFPNVTHDHSETADLNFSLYAPGLHLVSPNMVENALSDLSPNKNDVNAVDSSVLKPLCPNFILLLTSLYNGFLIHNHFPRNFSHSTLHSIFLVSHAFQTSNRQLIYRLALVDCVRVRDCYEIYQHWDFERLDFDNFW